MGPEGGGTWGHLLDGERGGAGTGRRSEGPNPRGNRPGGSRCRGLAGAGEGLAAVGEGEPDGSGQERPGEGGPFGPSAHGGGAHPLTCLGQRRDRGASSTGGLRACLEGLRRTLSLNKSIKFNFLLHF